MRRLGFILFTFTILPSACGPDKKLSDDAMHYLDLAEQTASWLLNQRDLNGERPVWPDLIQEPEQMSLSLSNGLSGKMMFLLELFKTTKKNKYKEELIFWADYLRENLPDSAGTALWPFSPYGAICGSGFALVETYKVTNDPRYKQGAEEILDLIERNAKNKTDTVSWDLGNDTLSGLSGTGLFLLYMSQELKEDSALQLAISAGKTLIDRAIKTENGWTWKRGQDSRFILPNFSHGAAGIGYFFARLYEATNEQEFLKAALASVRYLDSVAHTENGTYLIPYGFPDPGWRRPYDIGWAHGPAGVARLFYQMHKVTGEEHWLDRIDKCLNGILLSNPLAEVDSLFGGQEFDIDQRFGLASAGTFAFDIYSKTKKAECLEFGQSISGYIFSKATLEGGPHWTFEPFGFMQSPHDEVTFTGYFYGAAGIGTLFLRAFHSIQGTPPNVYFVDDPYGPN